MSADNWQKELRRLVGATPFETAVYVKNLSDGQVYGHNEVKPFPAASMIKLFVLWHLFKKAAGGEIDLSEEHFLAEKDIVEGGLLHRTEPGAKLRLSDLSLLMMSVSDNSATNILIERLGIAQINESIQKLGMGQTILGRKLMDFDAKKLGKDNFTSARDVGNILENIQISGGGMLDILSVQKNISKLPADIPFEDTDDLEAILAHKTGELPGHEHDGGILFHLSDHPVVVVAMTAQIPSRIAGCRFCANVGAIVYDGFLAGNNR